MAWKCESAQAGDALLLRSRPLARAEGDDVTVKVELLHGWQSGPASLAFYLDELILDDGNAGVGVIFEISTPTDPSDGTSVELGIGKLEFPAGKGRLEFCVAASLQQALAIRNGLTEILAEAVHNQSKVEP